MPRQNTSGNSSIRNPLGESENLNSSSYEDPETDNNAMRYSANTSPKPNSGPAFRNRSSRSVRDMELTGGANRTVRVSEGPNRSAGAVRKQPKPRKLIPGTKVLREIRKYQSSTDLLIPKLPFSRVVRETMHQYGNNFRITPQALMAIQEASEIYLAQFFEDSVRMMVHAKRVTLMPKDMQLINYLRGAWNLL